jgi:hypothetical protein
VRIMFVLVHHRVSDPEKFWRVPETWSLPRGMKLHASYPSVDSQRVTCLWECPSEMALREFVEKATTGIAANEYLPVSESRAIGLPTAPAYAPEQQPVAH